RLNAALPRRLSPPITSRKRMGDSSRYSGRDRVRVTERRRFQSALARQVSASAGSTSLNTGSATDGCIAVDIECTLTADLSNLAPVTSSIDPVIGVSAIRYPAVRRSSARYDPPAPSGAIRNSSPLLP